VSSDYFGEIRIWNLVNGECLRTFNAYIDIKDCYLKKLSRNSIISYTPDESKIKIWDTDTGNCLKVLQGETSSEILRLLTMDLF